MSGSVFEVAEIGKGVDIALMLMAQEILVEDLDTFSLGIFLGNSIAGRSLRCICAGEVYSLL